MNKQNQLKRICPRLLIASALVLSCLVLSPAVQAAPNSNTSYGRGALPGNTMGDFNSAFGVNALSVNSTGDFNTAIGQTALRNNASGNENTATGVGALSSNTTGSSNTANGAGALNNSTGNLNTALGVGAGLNVTTASNVIAIGTDGQNVSDSCFIGNIFGATSSGGTAVFINSAGKLGTTTSSRRFKDEIKPMDKASEAILALEPVTFRYKRDIDPAGSAQFGLVAEEVEKVNPDLVVRDAEGKPYTVRYEAVNAMLLNEFLKEHSTVQELKNEVAALTATVKEQAAQIHKMSAQLEVSKPAPQVVNNNQ
jgi:trimeric autotransporter adhesin